MDLNVGCGDHHQPGWLNIDINPVTGPDIAATLAALPFPDNLFDTVYAGHVLEHLDFDTEVPAGLAEIGRVLRPDGTLCLVGPDVDLADTLFDTDTARGARYGAGRWTGDVHQWACTESLLVDAARHAGFDTHPTTLGEVADAGWPLVSQVGWQCAIFAVLKGEPDGGHVEGISGRRAATCRPGARYVRPYGATFRPLSTAELPQ